MRLKFNVIVFIHARCQFLNSKGISVSRLFLFCKERKYSFLNISPCNIQFKTLCGQKNPKRNLIKTYLIVGLVFIRTQDDEVASLKLVRNIYGYFS